ncbi:hypothetical protein NEMBOFW57_005763 [Staphylotrichum longicolle]|uniref:Fungal specific transcription factor n=1 Tax=Staphylotrichum longicolle TaxID=669026 RepID=A0AAD4EXM7_9PEZI|nr:hypothetical protein NEMBOFW57_005763 [Staphylotrichum longicolle]
MGGLANSRHAPHPHAPAGNGHPPILPPPTLTVPPAPTGDVDHHKRNKKNNNHNRNHHSPVHKPHPPSPTPSPTPATTTTAPVPRTTHTNTRNNRPPPSAPHELARYSKIIRRLQWKLPFLAQGYRLAVDRVGANPAAVAEAELMFKLDFFEYYMLIERALVHLLGVFGVDVPRGQGQGLGLGQGQGQGQNKNNNTTKAAGLGLGASVWKDGKHRYHANVLAALDRAENPLHGTLGTGEVRVQLGRAKDLRNRWKTAADEHDEQEEEGKSPAKDGASPEREWRTRKVAAPLDTYRLEYMLEVVFRGFDEAFRVAEGFVRGGLDWAEECDEDMMEVPDWEAAGDEEDQWEFMVEAMDWEAV